MVVLSNNDGCAIARSNEAKALGIKMGEPWFKIRHLEEQAGLVSNALASLIASMNANIEATAPVDEPLDLCLIGFQRWEHAAA